MSSATASSPVTPATPFTSETIPVGEVNIITNADGTFSLQATSQDGKTIVVLPGQQEVLNWLAKCVTTS